MIHAEYFHQQILAHKPDGVDETSRDPESGSEHIWWQVRVPTLREMVKAWKAEHKSTLTYEDWLATLDQLYHSDSIDERQIAGMLMAEFPTFRRQLPLEQLDIWLGQLVGWKEVDSTCQSTFTVEDLLSDWESWNSFLRRLSVDDNINKRRASLVLLVKPIRSDQVQVLQLALDLVETLKHETDKLITKAISWLLREGTRQHHAEIHHYLDANRESLPAIAVRETQKKLDTGRK